MNLIRFLDFWNYIFGNIYFIDEICYKEEMMMMDYFLD